MIQRGLSVLILESGLERPDARIQSLSEALIKDKRFHEPMTIATCRALGGTSWLWGGRCTELEEIDLLPREYVPQGGWPMPIRELSRFNSHAAELLGIGNSMFGSSAATAREQYGDILFDHLENWTNETKIHDRLLEYKEFRNLRICTDATVVDLEFDLKSKLISGLVVTNERKKIVFRGARAYVLALGAVETARLLLNVQSREPKLFGGPGGVLGRYYMGHVSGTIADIKFSSPLTALKFEFQDQRGSSKRKRFTLSIGAQQAHRVLNIAFWPDNPALANAAHGNGFLSASYLLLRFLRFRSLLAEAIRANELRDPSPPWEHIKNCILDFSGLIRGGLYFMQQRYIKLRRLPRMFMFNREGIYGLHYHSEQLPAANNRITLSDERDYLGMRRAAIDFHYSDKDIDSVYKAHDLLDQSLRKTSIGELVFRVPREQFLLIRRACQADGLHQIGTTRMGEHPADGVVDSDCRVFGFENLFIAGSAVFRTSGQAAPTFSAIALALRLAEHLDETLKQKQGIAIRNASDFRRIRILHVISSIDVSSGGPSRAVFDLALAAQMRGHEVTICSTNFGGRSIDYSDYLKVGVAVLIFPTSGPNILQYSKAMECYLRDNIASFDIVHLHSLFLPHDWAVYRYATKHRIPYILRPHGTFDPVIRDRKRGRKWVLNMLFQQRVTCAAAGIHYTSRDEQNLSNSQNRTSWIVPLPIRPEEFDGQSWDSDFESKYGINSDFILFLGRLAWKKGADILIHAFNEFTKHYPHVDLVIAGPDNGEERKIRSLVQSFNLESKVHLTGVLDGPQRVAAYKLAKIFVLPSRDENFGRTAAEAMLVGTPIVMTDRVGIWEQVAQEDAACIVQADVNSVLNGLISVWESYPTALERARRARRLIENQYGIGVVGEMLERMYRDALKS
jgi:glycosyltransferase involved in cell wall biosynthesis/choline dehydrogenase-like flavoprotein